MTILTMVSSSISRIIEPAPEVMLERWFLNASPDAAATMRQEHSHGPRDRDGTWWRAPQDGTRIPPFPTTQSDLDKAAYHLRGTRHEARISGAIERVQRKVRQRDLGSQHLEAAVPALRAAMLGIYAPATLQVKLLRPARGAGFRGPRWWEDHLSAAIQ